MWYNALILLGLGRKGSICNRGLARKDRSGMYTVVSEKELGESAAKRRKQLQECEFQKGTVASSVMQSCCTAFFFWAMLGRGCTVVTAVGEVLAMDEYCIRCCLQGIVVGQSVGYVWRAIQGVCVRVWGV